MKSYTWKLNGKRSQNETSPNIKSIRQEKTIHFQVNSCFCWASVCIYISTMHRSHIRLPVILLCWLYPANYINVVYYFKPPESILLLSSILSRVAFLSFLSPSLSSLRTILPPYILIYTILFLKHTYPSHTNLNSWKTTDVISLPTSVHFLWNIFEICKTPDHKSTRLSLSPMPQVPQLKLLSFLNYLYINLFCLIVFLRKHELICIHPR